MDDRKKQRERRWRLLQFFGLALLVHLAAVPFLATLLPVASAEGPTRRVRLVNLQNPPKLPPHDRIQLPKQTPPDEPVDLKKLKGQVVDVPPTADDRAPDDARYLSEHNTRVERESRSRNQRQNYQNATNEPTVARKAELATPEKSHEAQAVNIGPEEPAKKQKETRQEKQEVTLAVPTMRQRDRLRLSIDDALGTLQNQRASEKVEGHGERLSLDPNASADAESRSGRDSAPTRAPKRIDLVPDVGVLARLNGAPSNDELKDLEEGEGTFLNSREFKYASFFNRLKRDVSQRWNPIAEYRRRDPSGNIYGHTSRLTVVTVTLRPDGTLANIAVTNSSGLDFLDREAIAAFTRAQPFPNPPHGLVDPTSGLISFPFGFHVDFSPGGGLRLPF